MIGRLIGRILERGPTQVVIDTGGVGYEVDIPLSTYTKLAGETDTVMLYTHLAVREDAHQLFGFATPEERELFRALIKVNGVGPKLALTILSGMDAGGLASCIHARDVKSLVALPGVGKKTAERLILDLTDRLPALSVDASGASAPAPASDNLADAEAALIELGFKPAQAALALARVSEQDADVETLIRQALKALA